MQVNCCKIAIVALLCQFLPFGALCNVASSQVERSADEILEEIKLVYQDFSRDQTVAPDLKRFNSIQDALKKIGELQDELGEQGIAALPTIKNSVLDNTLPLNVRGAILECSRKMEDKEAEIFLLEIAFDQPVLYNVAIGIFKWRKEHGEGVEIELSDAQLAHFSKRILEGDVTTALDASRDLNIFVKVPTESRIKPVVERFIQEIRSDVSDNPHPILESGSYREFVLCSFLRLFREIGPESRRYLEVVFRANDAELDIKRWLALALSATGEPSVSELVRSFIDDGSQHPETRAAAVRCYVKSAGRAAVDDLKRWSQDTAFVVEKLHATKKYPVASAAKLELSVLNRKQDLP